MIKAAFTGTLTLGVTEHQVQALLTKKGSRIDGAITLSNNNLIPILWKVSSSEDRVSTSSSTTFISPNDEIVILPELLPEDSSIEEFIKITISEAPITINGNPNTLSLVLLKKQSTEGIIETGLDEKTSPRLQKALSIRINQLGNQFDHFGNILSLPRLKKESNLEYRARIADVLANPAGSHYKGLLNGINRELGITQQQALEVKLRPVVGVDTSLCRFLLNEKEAVIYSQWFPLLEQEDGLSAIVEQRIDLADLTIGQLYNWLEQSSIYQGKILDHSIDKSSAANLIPTESRRYKTIRLNGQEILWLSKERNPIVPGSVKLSLEDHIEISWNQPFSDINEWKLDYKTGQLMFAEQPKNFEISFQENQKELLLKYTPIKIVSLISEAGQDLMFSQIEQDIYASEKERFINGLPTDYGYRMINKVMNTYYSQFWGK